MLTFVCVLDGIERALDLVDSLCTLLTAAMQERRFCFEETVGFSIELAGLLQDAVDDNDDDNFSEDADFFTGAGQKLGSAVLILRPFSSYWFLAAAIFLLCCLNNSSRLASVSHFDDVCFALSVGAKASLPIPLLLKFSGITPRDLWLSAFFSCLLKPSQCWAWFKVPIFTPVTVSTVRIGLLLPPNSVSLTSWAFLSIFSDLLERFGIFFLAPSPVWSQQWLADDKSSEASTGFLLAPWSANWLEHCPEDDKILAAPTCFCFESGIEGSSLLFLPACLTVPLTALDNKEVFGEPGDEDETELLRVWTRVGVSGELLTGTRCGEKAATSLKLLLLSSLSFVCDVSSEKTKQKQKVSY